MDAILQVSWPGRQLLAHDSSWCFTPCFSLQYLAMLELKLGFQASGEVVLLALKLWFHVHACGWPCTVDATFHESCRGALIYTTILRP